MYQGAEVRGVEGELEGVEGVEHVLPTQSAVQVSHLKTSLDWYQVGGQEGAGWDRGGLLAGPLGQTC